MDKVKETLLADFKKSNKARKLKLAQKYGFSTSEEYLQYLNGVVVDIPTPKVTEDNVPTDIVIAFDTTGSMASYIGDVKKHVAALIPELFTKTNNVRISIVAFGDYCDMKSSKVFGRAYQVIDLTDDTDELISFVKGAMSTGGGDGDEFYELVLHKIRTETSWRESSNKSILLIADDNPHRVGYSYGSIVKNAQIDWRQEAKLCKSSNIKVDTLSIHGYPWYEELSEMTDGINMKFQSSHKTSKMMEGYTYARSGSTVMFAETFSTVMDSGDAELIGVYKTLSTL